MTDKLTISGESDDWVMFSRTLQGRHPMFIRSRTGVPEVREFAEKNFFARLRCTIPPEEQSEGGLPKSTAALDAFEDALLAALTAANAQTYLIRVTTGHGTRDFYFSAVEGGELSAALKSIPAGQPFTIGLAKGDPAPFLTVLTLSHQERAKANFVGVAVGSQGLLGKLFGR